MGLQPGSVIVLLAMVAILVYMLWIFLGGYLQA
jgi:hypothetical protein